MQCCVGEDEVLNLKRKSLQVSCLVACDGDEKCDHSDKMEPTTA